MGFFNKLINKITNKASDKIADKAVNKLFGGKKETNSTTDTTTTTTTEAPTTTTTTATTEQVNVNIDPAQMAMFTAFANQGSQAGMAQANEIMKYLEFDENMEVIGVKEDAPDYLKMAYKSGKLNKKD